MDNLTFIIIITLLQKILKKGGMHGIYQPIKEKLHHF